MKTKKILLAALLMVGITTTAFAQENRERPGKNQHQAAPKREMQAPKPMGIDCAMATTMKLTIKQVYAIGQSEIDAKEAMKALGENKELSREDMRTQMKEIMEKQKETIKTTLSTEQYISYLEHQLKGQPKERGERKPEMGGKKGGERPEKRGKDATKAEKE